MSSFKTKARTVELLGRKQIRDSVTALAELMKNSYDADASLLRVEFDTISEKQRVIIADNGIGMSQEDIETKWLVLGTNSKVRSKNNTSPDGRPLMGAKGIGRLASATLGRQMWMLSKTKNSQWNIVYIHWDLFGNPNLSIEDVNIPTRFGIPQTELVERLEDYFYEMINEQKINVMNCAWKKGEAYSDDAQKIISDLEALSVDVKAVKKFICGFDHGTVMYIDSLHDNWNKYIGVMSSEARKNDTMIEKMYNRFASFVSTFSHTPVPNIPFSVEVYVDGKKWEDDLSFDDGDYELYDVKVKGRINHGHFYGKLFARNADAALLEKCNAELEKGICVTAGMTDWGASDCGEFSIEFCHIEGENKRSGLSEDDYKRLKRKLEVTCGICVYRDGVRVLPYGEPENDFLNIEARRTEKAGRYIFSHRNIFGRIDIDSEHNPMLEDKSSREGIIENQYYFYFVRTLENLLIDLAINYLSTVRRDSLGIQESYVKKNKEKHDREKALEVIRRKEKGEIVEQKKRVDIWIQITPHKIMEVSNAVLRFHNKCIRADEEISVSAGYTKLTRYLDLAEREKTEIEQRIEELKNSRYYVEDMYEHYYKDEELERIYETNTSIDTACIEMGKKIDIAIGILKDVVQREICKWTESIKHMGQKGPDEVKEELVSRIDMLISEMALMQDTVLKEYIPQVLGLRQKLTSVDELQKEIYALDSYKEIPEWKEMEQLLNKIESEKGRIESIIDNEPAGVIKKSHEMIEIIEQYREQLSEVIVRFRVACRDKILSWTRRCSDIENALDYSGTELNALQIISLLRQQNYQLNTELDIYSDLANIGLAAEIVSHEFNQLFINVGDAIKNLKPYMTNTSAQYWLQQIDIGFRSISARQTQLSPMYRSYSLRKDKVNLKAFIDDIKLFIQGELERGNVELKNEVIDSTVLLISKSKVFPAICNLINNSIYWVSDRKEKIIVVRYETKHRALYIEDSGPGITVRNKENIFQPFFTKKPNGRGLGLTVAKKVLESQGHKLEIVPDEEKTLSGAAFRIVFSEDATEV